MKQIVHSLLCAVLCCISVTLVAQKITGRVTESGQPLIGVTVLVVGTSTGTTTEIDGSYSIQASRGDSLQFSYVGYQKQTIAVGNATVMNVEMEVSGESLNEVIVIGYGSVRKSDLTASVSSVKGEDIRAFPTAGVDQALTARASGINVTQASGAPGGGVTVRIRGSNSIQAGSEPLYVVDGIPIYSNNDAFSAGGNRQASNALASINPNDIESVEILKDASGTAIYGSRGANGVVLITTKRGKAGSTKINYEGGHSFQTVAKTIELMNATEYAQYQNARAISRGQSAPYANPSQFGEGINWLDQTTQTGSIINHQLSFSGGSERMTFNVSGNYFNNEGIIKNTGFERGSLRLNLDAKFLNDRLRLGTSTLLSRTTTDAIPTDRGGPGGAIITILGQNPIGTGSGFNGPFNADGSYFLDSYDGRFLTSPLAEVLEVLDTDRGMRMLTNNYLSYEIVKGLTFRTSAGFDIFSNNRETYYSRETRLGRERNRSYELGNRSVDNFLNENTLNYVKTIGKGNLSALAGYTYQTDVNRFFGTSTNNFTFDDFNINRIQNGVTLLQPFSSRTFWTLKSFIGRLNYSYLDKYLVTMNFRRDGSSRFGEQNKWANFPSVAVAWRAINESFMQDNNLFSDLKFRASWGITGNSEIPIGNSLAELSGNRNYLLNDQVVAGVAEGRVSNPNLKWETTQMLNFGVDMGFMDNRITLTADWFRNQTSDLLLFVALPTSSGFTSALKNSGELVNTGFELSSNIAAIRKTNTSLSFNLNASFLKNEVVSLAGTPPFYSYTGSHLGPEGSYVAEGLPLGGWFGYQAIGIWQSEEEIRTNPSLAGIDKPGYVRYQDVNGDGKIDLGDRTYLGHPNPKFIWGASTDFRWKNLDISVFFRGSHGQKIRNQQASEHADGVGNYNQYKSVATDSWSPNNRGASRPIVDATREFPSFFRRSSFFIEDGSFVRLQNLAVGYSVKNLKGISSLRVYASGQNLALFTNYSGWDPEVSNGGQSPLNRGDDYDAYPRARTITFGVQLGL